MNGSGQIFPLLFVALILTKRGSAVQMATPQRALLVGLTDDRMNRYNNGN
ncbi:hypothetical protein [Limosilactobacillus antri]|nr:hypothetical protein [Limosilactobacillus antri]